MSTISVPSIVVGQDADGVVQHLATDVNDALGRLTTALEAELDDIQTELDAIDLSLYATLASPVFTGNPTAPTPSANDNDTSIATTAYVQTELADYSPLASPTFTGTPAAPSAAGTTDTTQIATTAFTQDAIDARAATAAQISAGTGSTFISPAATTSAYASVALTEAVPVAIDWTDSLAFSLTLSANRQLGNPTNGIPNTQRTLLLKGDAVARTLTFASNYLGTIPTITDVTSSKWYLLTIFCVSSTHFLVSAVVAKP